MRFVTPIACTLFLASAGAFAQVQLNSKGETRRIQQMTDCANLAPSAAPVTLDVLQRCAGYKPVDRVPTKADLGGGRRGPLILQEIVGLTNNTSTVAGIETLVSFGPLVMGDSDFPADIAILPSDPLHLYQLTSEGVVSRYDASGTSTPVSTLAPPAGQEWSDLAVDPTSGDVYAASVLCGTSSALSKVNLLTGATTLLGPITGAACLVGLAADNTGQLYGYDTENDSLLRIDKTTGAATVVGPLGFNANFAQAMDCDPVSGTCYLFAVDPFEFFSQLRSVNLITGASTMLGEIGASVPAHINQIPSAVFGAFGPCVTNADCDDGNLCNGIETCAAPACVLGTPVVCQDGDLCTLDVCTQATGACSFPADPCDDGDGCTVDTCRAGAGCDHEAATPIEFCNPQPFTIPDIGSASVYPSSIPVSGLGTRASVCRVRLNGFSHTFPQDVDMMLVGPAGGAQNAVIVSDVGGGTDAVDLSLVLEDAAPSSLPAATPLFSGTFKPTNIGTEDQFAAPAPTPTGNSYMGVLSGNPNGTWQLFVTDGGPGDAGSMSGGWCLGLVVGTCSADSACDDGDVCNGVETCLGGTCIAGTPVSCEDGNVCTLDSCNPETGACSHAPNRCSDGDPCTQDSCSPETGCGHVALTPVSFCTGPITIPSSGSGTPYPSTVTVSGVSPLAALCSVTLRRLSHTFPDDIDVLLQGPNGTQNSRILSDVGGNPDIVEVDLTFKDAASASIPDHGPIVSGTFRPTNSEPTDLFPPPAPPPDALTTLSNFTGDPNGTWRLFVVDDAGGDQGTLSEWCLDIVTEGCETDPDCDDGDFCNGAETCQDGQCQPGTSLSCDDGNACTVDSCVPADGSCTHAPTNCDDGDSCTFDSCDPATGCGHVNRCLEFCNTGAIALTDSPAPPTAADPYPSAVPVSLPPFQGVASVAQVKLNGLTHTFPGDLDLLLVGPTGANAIVMSDVGAGFDVTDLDLVLSDAAAAPLLAPAPLVAGTFRPTNITPGSGTEEWPAPAPAPSGVGSALSVFTGLDPNGTWNLFAVDDAEGDSGSLGSWCVAILVTCTSNAQCDDGDACTDDACIEGQCRSMPSTCDDGDPCTADSCDAASGCVSTEIPGCRCSAPEPNPHARGYWKSLCQGPHSGDELTADDPACVAGLGDQFADVTSVADLCDVLNGAGNPCVQGAIELMSLALNLCHQNVCADTPLSSQYGSNTSVGASYDQADDLLSSGGDCLLAKRLSSEINTGRAINVNSVSFAKLTGGRARIQWTAMGGGSTPIVKYNVWRRQAGSLAPFVKIGETTSMNLEDSTPGSFEYEVTPVR